MRVTNPLRIMLVDDLTLLREGLKLLISFEKALVVAAEASTGEEALELFDADIIDVVLMDMTLPGMDGAATTTAIRAKYPAAKVIMLSASDNRKFVQAALAAGASGYLDKRHTTISDVVMACYAAMNGGMFISPSACKRLVDGFALHDEISNLLTDRQVEILKMIALGQTIKQIACDLDLSVKTVETHRAQILSRLGLRSVAALVLYAVRHGLVTAVESPPESRWTSSHASDGDAGLHVGRNARH